MGPNEGSRWILLGYLMDPIRVSDDPSLILTKSPLPKVAAPGFERTHQLWAPCDPHAHQPWAPCAHQPWALCGSLSVRSVRRVRLRCIGAQLMSSYGSAGK